MRLSFAKITFGIAALTAALLSASTAEAQTLVKATPAPVKSTNTKAPIKANNKPTGVIALGENEQGMLRDAYRDLFIADHDYSGHRIRAMHQIEDAAKLLGLELKGDGKAGEKQIVSDEHLQSARSLLEKMLPGIPAGQKKVHEHVHAAIKQLNIALKLK